MANNTQNVHIVETNALLLFIHCLTTLIYRAGAKGAMFLLPLLGLSWIFGIMAVNKDLLVFEYLFAVFNSLQVNVMVYCSPPSISLLPRGHLVPK